MVVEPYKSTNHLPMSGEVTGQSGVVHLTPHGTSQPRKTATPVKSDPEVPTIDLSEYQRKLLEEIQKNPALTNILQMIFRKYPELIIKEYRLTSPNATKRQKLNGRKVSMERLRLEADLEQQLCRLAGIDVNEVKASVTQQPERTVEEVEEAIIEEENTPVDIKEPEKKVTKKKPTKKSKKKTTKKINKDIDNE